MFIFGIVMLPIWWVLTKATGVESKELLSRFLANVSILYTREKFDSEYNHFKSIFADSVSQFNNPSEAQRILEEIESVIRADNHGFSLLQVKKLSYL